MLLTFITIIVLLVLIVTIIIIIIIIGFHYFSIHLFINFSKFLTKHFIQLS